MTQCQFVKLDGAVCQAKHTKNSTYCFRHDPANRQKSLAASRTGGLNRRLQGEFSTEKIQLETPQDIRIFLGEVINAVYTGKIPVAVGSSMGFLARCWLDAYDAGETEAQLEALNERLNQQGV